MMQGEIIKERSDRMRHAIGKAYGIKAKSLDRAASRAGRQLPKSVQEQVARVLEAERAAGNPKLLRQKNDAELAAAEQALHQHLQGVDRAGKRRDAIRDWGVRTGITIFLVFGAFALWVMMSGRV